MDEAALSSALSDLPLGGLRYFTRTGSTNDDAAAWQKAGAHHLSLVVAGEQTAGRGRDSRTWYSPPGSSLAFSLVLKPVGIRAASLPRLTGLGALAVCKALEKEIQLDAQIKWPNDVLVERKKVAGVLVEATWLGNQLDAVILGIGINLTQDAVHAAARMDGSLRFPAGSISGVGKPVNAINLLRAILEEILHGLEQIETREFILDWQKRLAFQDETVQIVASAGSLNEQIETGRIAGLQQDGALLLQTERQGIMTVHSGEVRLLPLIMGEQTGDS